jgi:signal-transduction protein with cAMP-binding, CBS, and nucleotidyltransferase domain
MKQKWSLFGDANRDARPVKDIIKPARTIPSKVSVQAALNELQAQGVDWSPITDQRGELLGAVSRNEMNRTVGGMGHDPKTELVEAHVEKTMSIASKTRQLRRRNKLCATQMSPKLL